MSEKASRRARRSLYVRGTAQLHMYHSSQVGRLLENVKQGKNQYYETFSFLASPPESLGGPSTSTILS